MKKIYLPLALALAVGNASAGVPTFDYANAAAMAQELMQLQAQYETLKQQYQTMQNVQGNLEGSYGRGSVGLDDSLDAASVVPGSWQEVVSQQSSGAYGSKQSYYEDLINTMPQELFDNPEGQRAKGYQLSSNSVRAAMSGGDALYSEVQVHLNNLATLAAQVDTTTNAKDAADLQNRIAAENGMLSSAQSKLSALNMNLQANLSNAENQATADNQKFFTWSDQ